MRPDFTLQANYVATWSNYGDVLGNTLLIAAGHRARSPRTIAFCFAYAIRFKAGRFGDLLLFLALITLFGGYLVKIYAWKSILGRDGILNKALLGLGLIDQPIDALLYSVDAVVMTLTYFLLPFAILPIYGSLRAIKEATIESARDLGAGRCAVMRDIILPQCESGLTAAFTLSFLISVGDYVTPRFVGGGTAMIGNFIEHAILPRLQLAAWAAPCPSRSWLRRWRSCWSSAACCAAAASAAMSGRAGRISLWQGFSLLVLLFMMTPLAAGRAVRLQPLGPDQPAAHRLHLRLVSQALRQPLLLAGAGEQPDRRMRASALASVVIGTMAALGLGAAAARAGPAASSPSSACR